VAEPAARVREGTEDRVANVSVAAKEVAEAGARVRERGEDGVATVSAADPTAAAEVVVGVAAMPLKF